MRDMAGSAAAPAVRCRNCRRGSFMTMPPDNTKTIPVAVPVKGDAIPAYGPLRHSARLAIGSPPGEKQSLRGHRKSVARDP